MRLGQLSRKISVRPAEIAAYLLTKGIVVEDNANTKMTDEQVRIVLERFAAELEVDEIIEVPESADGVGATAIPEESVSDLAIIATEEPETEQIKSEDGSSAASPEPQPDILQKSNARNEEILDRETNESPVEVIKAPKVELPGLRVVGKIELPEPKKKEVPGSPLEVNQNQLAEPPKKSIDYRKEKISRGRESNRPRKNSVALQREREAREAEERKKEELQRQKENKTQFYMQRVKPATPARRVRLVDEPLEELKDMAPEPPKTLWGKFIKWLTSH